jgi:hypothetical protein
LWPFMCVRAFSFSLSPKSGLPRCEVDASLAEKSRMSRQSRSTNSHSSGRLPPSVFRLPPSACTCPHCTPAYVPEVGSFSSSSLFLSLTFTFTLPFLHYTRLNALYLVIYFISQASMAMTMAMAMAMTANPCPCNKQYPHGTTAGPIHHGLHYTTLHCTALHCTAHAERQTRQRASGAWAH